MSTSKTTSSELRASAQELADLIDAIDGLDLDEISNRQHYGRIEVAAKLRDLAAQAVLDGATPALRAGLHRQHIADLAGRSRAWLYKHVNISE